MKQGDRGSEVFHEAEILYTVVEDKKGKQDYFKVRTRRISLTNQMAILI